tara:strand:- start:2984 stop:3331 length:348 start_codon:yes stop_codon:yes gene_type:complete
VKWLGSIPPTGTKFSWGASANGNTPVLQAGVRGSIPRLSTNSNGAYIMKNLIKALQIFLKYGNPDYPTHCEHDELWICGIDPADVSDEDIAILDDLGFFVEEDEECFKSYRYGSA